MTVNRLHNINQRFFISTSNGYNNLQIMSVQFQVILAESVRIKTTTFIIHLLFPRRQNQIRSNKPDQQDHVLARGNFYESEGSSWFY